MKRSVSILLCLAATLGAAAANAEEGRFDAQTFKPSPAPRDLVMVQKSEVMGHLSPSLGLYSDFALDPLAIAALSTGKQVTAVGARVQVTPLFGIGFYDWFDVTLAVPLVAWQTGDNLRPLGTEGSVSPSSLGDIRLSTKIAIPGLNRKARIKEGFGMAVTGNLNLPTGNQDAFTSDGVVTGGAGLIADYRFNFGLLVAANTGVWLRPDRQFAGTKVGDMASWGLMGEMYVVQRWGLSVIGGAYGYVQLSHFPDTPAQVPAEALMALRWQGKKGITITAGGTFGANCGFGAPVFRLFGSITWQPKNSREQEEINRLQEIDRDDPDHDGLNSKVDKCPNEPGLPTNFGCPEQDTDGDGILDRDDACKDLAGGPHGKNGCPTAYMKGDEIVILDQVNFATDRDIILDGSKPVLEEVAHVLEAHPEIRELRIEGHTDVRASDAYNMNLSQRRVDSVMRYLVERGIDPARLAATGMGHTKPIYDDKGCIGPDEKLSDACKFMTSKNRRVIFRIVRMGAPPPKPIGGGDGNSSVLPTKENTLPDSNLPSDGVLDGASNLPGAGTNLPSNGGILPSKGSSLPSGGVLKAPGVPNPAPSTAPAPAPKK